MDLSSWFEAGGHSDREVLWQDDERVVCRAWRYGSDGDRLRHTSNLDEKHILEFSHAMPNREEIASAAGRTPAW
jgi:hypothetical protein